MENIYFTDSAGLTILEFGTFGNTPIYINKDYDYSGWMIHPVRVKDLGKIIVEAKGTLTKCNNVSQLS